MYQVSSKMPDSSVVKLWPILPRLLRSCRLAIMFMNMKDRVATWGGHSGNSSWHSYEGRKGWTGRQQGHIMSITHNIVTRCCNAQVFFYRLSQNKTFAKISELMPFASNHDSKAFMSFRFALSPLLSPTREVISCISGKSLVIPVPVSR